MLSVERKISTKLIYRFCTFMCFFVLPLYVVFAIIGPSFEAKDSSAVTHNFKIPSVSISSIDDFSLEVAPDEYGSDSHSFTVSTTNYTGYTLSLKTTGQTRELVNTSDSTKMIPTVSLPAGQQSVVAADLSGYGYSMDGVRYKPVPNPGASTVVNTRDSAGSDTLSLTFGARVNIEIPEGDYTNDFALTVSANDGGYFVAYDENTPATVSNMPNPNPELGRVTGLGVTLSDNIPLRPRYRFLGWAKSKNATIPDYQPGERYGITQSSGAVIFLYAVWEELDAYVIHFNGSDATSGTMDSQEAFFDVPVTLRTNRFARDGYTFVGWSTSRYNAYIRYVDGDTVTNIANDNNEITLYAIWQGNNTEYFNSSACVFNGRYQDVVGDCANGEHVDFINTGITPFTQDNIDRNFILEFTVDDSEIGLVDHFETIFNLKLENDDEETGHYPGLVMRVNETGKRYELTAKDGLSVHETVYFTKSQIHGKKIRIIRHRGNIYYQIGDDEPHFLISLAKPSIYFNTALTFGANLQPSNKLPDRYLVGTMSDISFNYYDDETTYREFVYGGNFTEQEDTPTLHTVLNIPGVCIFNGSSNITGNCGSFTNTANHIDTGLSLLDSTNFANDFDIYFELVFDTESQTAFDGNKQNTILNIKSERSDLGYPGIVLRRNDHNDSYLQLGIRMTSKYKQLDLPASIDSFRLIKVGTKVCYSLNGGQLKLLHDMDGFDQFIPDTLLLGSSADANGNPWRFINGEMSNIRIRTGKFTAEDNIQCK